MTETTTPTTSEPSFADNAAAVASQQFKDGKANASDMVNPKPVAPKAPATVAAPAQTQTQTQTHTSETEEEDKKKGGGFNWRNFIGPLLVGVLGFFFGSSIIGSVTGGGLISTILAGMLAVGAAVGIGPSISEWFGGSKTGASETTSQGAGYAHGVQSTSQGQTQQTGPVGQVSRAQLAALGSTAGLAWVGNQVELVRVPAGQHVLVNGAMREVPISAEAIQEYVNQCSSGVADIYRGKQHNTIHLECTIPRPSNGYRR